MKNRNEEFLRKGAEAPAEFLDRSIATTQGITAALPGKKLVKKTGNYWHMLGPGLTTGASDDDPSGIATYSQAGAQYGYGLLWLSAWTFPLMAIVQEMCARIGLVTGRGLAGNIRVYFSKRVLIVCTMLLFMANAFNIGADIGAMATAAQLIHPQLNFYALVVGFTGLCLFLQIFMPYARYARYLKWLALILLSYIFSTLMADINWHTVLSNAFTPKINFDKEQLFLICAILGTTISPYLFFWQTSQEVEEQILQGKTTLAERQVLTAPEDIRSMRIDVWSGMFLSNLVMFFIIAACGSILFPQGITNITSAAEAAEALRPFAGDATYFLFAVGIIGTGLLAIPVLAGSSSYAISETFRWNEGLYRSLGKKSYAFYGIIIISMLVGMGLNFVGIDPIKALIYSAIANAFVAPIILLLIVLMSSNKKIMGRWVNKRHTTVIGWMVTLAMTLAGLAAIYAILS